jgi:exosome complex RNA-binding protein Rrp4|tara:strand:+ start:334 stop:615 length:282 start_codon:yes stop_codon:yes gene_type:complete
MQLTKHMPNLKTVIMVEDVIKNSENSLVTIPEIKRALPKKVNHNTLMTILEYLEESRKILVGIKGIIWLDDHNPKLSESIRKGTDYEDLPKIL